MKNRVFSHNSKGFTIGELAVVFAVAAVLILAFTPVIRHVNQRQVKVECDSNLKKVGVALYMYANRNDGRFPPSLKTLYEEKYLSDKTIMNCPASKTIGTIDDPDYAYVPDLSLKTADNQLLVYDKEGNHPGGGRNVLYLNGGIVWQE